MMEVSFVLAYAKFQPLNVGLMSPVSLPNFFLQSHAFLAQSTVAELLRSRGPKDGQGPCGALGVSVKANGLKVLKTI